MLFDNVKLYMWPSVQWPRFSQMEEHGGTAISAPAVGCTYRLTRTYAIICRPNSLPPTAITDCIVTSVIPTRHIRMAAPKTATPTFASITPLHLLLRWSVRNDAGSILCYYKNTDIQGTSLDLPLCAVVPELFRCRSCSCGDYKPPTSYLLQRLGT